MNDRETTRFLTITKKVVEGKELTDGEVKFIKKIKKQRDDEVDEAVKGGVVIELDENGYLKK